MIEEFEIQRRELEVRLRLEGIEPKPFGQTADGFARLKEWAAEKRMENNKIFAEVHAKIVADLVRSKGTTANGMIDMPLDLPEGKGRVIKCIYCREEVGILDVDLPGPLTAVHLTSLMAHRDPDIHLHPTTEWQYAFCLHGQHRFTETPWMVLVNDGVRYLAKPDEVKEEKHERQETDDAGGDREPDESQEPNGDSEKVGESPATEPPTTW